MKKTIALLLTLVMVFGLAASFPAYADDEIVINFPSIWVGTDSKAAYMSKLIDDFNAENGTHIVSVSAVHCEPMGLYAGKQSSLDVLQKVD